MSGGDGVGDRDGAGDRDGVGGSLLDERMSTPTHVGAMDSPSAVGAVGNPACGDVVTLYLRIDDGRIVDASFESIGSRYQLATASVLCDCVIGQDLDGARRRTSRCVLDKLPDLPQRNRYLARLAIDALQRALDRHERGEPAVADEALEALDDERATHFVATVLRARPMATMELEAMAEAEGYRLPGGTARFLSQLRGEGLVRSEMSDDHRAWRWSLAEAA